MARPKFDVVDEYVRTACGDLEILARPEISDLDALLRATGSKYKAFVVAKKYEEATTEDCAQAAANNLEALVREGSYIRGLTLVKAASIHANLCKLASIMGDFELRQDAGKWEGRLTAALDLVRRSDVLQPGFAGSALRT